MAVSQIYNAIPNDLITAARWNNEFGNIYNNGTRIAFPVTEGVSFAGKTIALDAAGGSSITSTAGTGLRFSPGSHSAVNGTVGYDIDVVASFADTLTAMSGTASAAVFTSFQRPTVFHGNTGVTVTDAATVYIANAPAAGANTTLTNAWALWAGGDIRVDGNISNSQILFAPQGRLTPTTGVPILVADKLAASTIYYTPYLGASWPHYNGSIWTMLNIGPELSLALDSDSGHTGYHVAGGLFDFFLIKDGATQRLGTGPAWSSATARGTGAGTTELERYNGFWVNKNSIVIRFGTSSGNTVTIPARQATFVGSAAMFSGNAASAALVEMKIHPAAESGGTYNTVGLSNAYNRRQIVVTEIDAATSWNYASTTVRAANNDVRNRINFIDCLGESSLEAIYRSTVAGTGAGATAATVGVELDALTNLGVAGTIVTQAAFTTTAEGDYLEGSRRDFGKLGFHFYHALEQSTAVSVTFFGNGFSALTLSIEM